MTGSLAGLRVVEIGGDIAAPYCTKLLVDLGADVYKVEPLAGDPLRNWGTSGGLFGYLNAGKRGMTIDLATDATALHDVLARADMLVENLPAGSAERFDWGIDRDALQRINPKLVVVRISDYGQEGPRRDHPSTPLTVQAASGWVNTRELGRPPVQSGARIPEYIAGGYAALGALTALAEQAVERRLPLAAHATAS